MEELRFCCHLFWVDVGTGKTRDGDLFATLEDFHDVRDELLSSLEVGGVARTDS